MIERSKKDTKHDAPSPSDKYENAIKPPQLNQAPQPDDKKPKIDISSITDPVKVCKKWKKFHVVPGSSWGDLNLEQQR